MGLPVCVVDAFADKPFTGNPAAVVFLDGPRDAAWKQSIAAEFNLSETAFVEAAPAGFSLSWFTPSVEVPLCGHATLASAHALFAELGLAADLVTFDTQSGPLPVERSDAGYEMDFPADPPRRVETPAGLAAAMGAEPVEVWAARYLIALLPDEAAVRGLAPDLAAVHALASPAGRPGNLIVAAAGDPGGPYDLVSRFFAPASGIPEDPTTGSAHCMLAPLFAGRLGRARLACHQAYPGRGGDLTAEVRGDRVLLGGRAVTVVESRLRI